MKLDNATSVPATLLRGELRPGEMLAIVVARTTHPVRAHGGLGPHDPDAAPPQATQQATPLGIVPGDRVPVRDGVDLWVHGHVERERPVTATEVCLRVGDAARTLVVVGDRRFRADGSIEPPQPLQRLPLTYAYAYGGTLVSDALECSHPENPDGRGFVPDRRAAEGVALPNIEWRDDRLHTWSDRPQPAGFAPLASGAPMQLLRSVRVDPDAPAGFRVTREHHRCAHPRLCFGRLDPGTPIVLTGVGVCDAIAFALPPAWLSVEVTLGAAVHALPLCLDAVGVLADEATVQLSYRAAFRYHPVQHQRRRVRLLARGGGPWQH